MAVLLGFALVSCVAAPYQEMSDARQIVAAVETEIQQSGYKDNTTIIAMLNKSKAQLKIAKNMLEEGRYEEAKEYAQKAGNLAKLARLQMQQLNK